eukprot:1480626-Amphidinium_carterae.1
MVQDGLLLKTARAECMKFIAKTHGDVTWWHTGDSQQQVSRLCVHRLAIHGSVADAFWCEVSDYSSCVILSPSCAGEENHIAGDVIAETRL